MPRAQSPKPALSVAEMSRPHVVIVGGGLAGLMATIKVAEAGLPVDLAMKGLKDYYAQVAKVNKGMAARIRATKREDGTINAIVLLDMFVLELPYGIQSTLTELKPLFASYLNEKTSVM